MTGQTDHEKASPAPVPQVVGLIQRIAATPIWRDTYPDGPDLIDGSYTLTSQDVRDCRAALATATEGSGE